MVSGASMVLVGVGAIIFISRLGYNKRTRNPENVNRPHPQPGAFQVGALKRRARVCESRFPEQPPE